MAPSGLRIFVILRLMSIISCSGKTLIVLITSEIKNKSEEKRSHSFGILISSFFEIDFEIKTSAKKSRRFHLSEVIFKWVKIFKISINMLKQVKIDKNVANAKMS